MSKNCGECCKDLVVFLYYFFVCLLQGYSNVDNPFGDEHLTETFVWKKKISKEGKEELDHEQIQKMTKEKMEQNRVGLNKVGWGEIVSHLSQTFIICSTLYFPNNLFCYTSFGDKLKMDKNSTIILKDYIVYSNYRVFNFLSLLG